MRTLYYYTYHRVASILVGYGTQHVGDMVRTVRTAIKMGLTRGDMGTLTTTCTVSALLEVYPFEEGWEDTGLLEQIVDYLPKEEKTLATGLLDRYNSYLEVYKEVFPVQDSLTKDVAAPDVTKTNVEVTVAKNLSEFTCKDCTEMLKLLLHSCKIPHNEAMVTAIKPGSTTVVFLLDKTFTGNIIHYSVEASALWAFQELSVTRVRIGVFELNVVQLLTQHFKEALRNGLTGDMDFVGAVKVCIYTS